LLPLLNALFARFTASSALVSAFPGGFFRDRAPEAATMPYLISHVTGSKAALAYGGIYRVETEVCFSAYGVGHDAVGSAIQTLLAQLDNQPLMLSVGTNDTVARFGEPVPKLHRQDAQGNDVWEWSVTYSYNILS
jgi:hypothetical protein